MQVKDLIVELQKLPDQSQEVSVYGTGLLQEICNKYDRRGIILRGLDVTCIDFDFDE